MAAGPRRADLPAPGPSSPARPAVPRDMRRTLPFRGSPTDPSRRPGQALAAEVASVKGMLPAVSRFLVNGPSPSRSRRYRPFRAHKAVTGSTGGNPHTRYPGGHAKHVPAEWWTVRQSGRPERSAGTISGRRAKREREKRNLASAANRLRERITTVNADAPRLHGQSRRKEPRASAPGRPHAQVTRTARRSGADRSVCGAGGPVAECGKRLPKKARTM